MSHSTCTHRGRVNSWLLVVGSQIVNLTFDPFFCHNLCYRCPNGSCESIFDIYTLISFQWYEKRFTARCFDPCNRALKFWESRRTQESQRTPKSSFRECECHPHTLPKVVLRHLELIKGRRGVCLLKRINIRWLEKLSTLDFLTLLHWIIICCRKKIDDKSLGRMLALNVYMFYMLASWISLHWN
jgi:hypothetical protein